MWNESCNINVTDVVYNILDMGMQEEGMIIWLIILVIELPQVA